MGTMIERVARAICAAHDVTPCGVSKQYFGEPDAMIGLPPNKRPMWTYYIPQARAAIAAMREPTLEMERAGDSLSDSAVSFQRWEVMIDAALSEVAKPNP